MKRKLRILMTAMVPLIFCSGLKAQTTVSGYERSLSAQAPASAPEQKPDLDLDLDQLSRRLQAAGWQVERDGEGNLVARRAQQDERDEGEDRPWTDVERQLQQSGWSTRRDADGSLILTPPATPETVDSRLAPDQDGDTGSFEQMQQKLRAAGWKVNETADGSILLYPPGKGDSAGSKPVACAGTPLVADIELPVDSWTKANRVARSWLSQQADFNAAVGRIRKVLNVYVISIVADTPPHKLIQQIAIRRTDGAVVVLN